MYGLDEVDDALNKDRKEFFNLLIECRYSLDEHDRDYQYVTPKELIEKIENMIVKLRR